MAAFLEKLQGSSHARRSLLCIGLDPHPEAMPVKDLFQFNRAVIDATHDLACAYKPNLAFYEAQGLPGMEALLQTVEYIRTLAPDIPVLGDAKRGDIGTTARAYAQAMFDCWKFDAVTVNPYLGTDAIEPFLAYDGRGILVLVRTSNPGARDLQDLHVIEAGQEVPLYLKVAHLARRWSAQGSVGLVVGATYPEELRLVREACPDLLILIPGVGAQGGSLEGAVRYGVDRHGRRAIINASRGVVHASRGADFAQAARREAGRLRDAINLALEAMGLGW